VNVYVRARSVPGFAYRPGQPHARGRKPRLDLLPSGNGAWKSPETGQDRSESGEIRDRDKIMNCAVDI
jgi:hypothetical protein